MILEQITPEFKNFLFGGSLGVKKVDLPIGHVLLIRHANMVNLKERLV